LFCPGNDQLKYSIEASEGNTPVGRGLILIVRPRQWVKNGFVLAPLVFTESFLDVTSVVKALSAMLLFCVASSTAYIINDIHDVEYDRKHPEKATTRPLASGAIEKRWAIALLALLYLILVLAYFYLPEVTMVIAAYCLLNLIYTFVLKYQPVIDIFTIAISFVLRVYAGAVALSVPLSSWMFVTTLCLALYLAAIKRRQELAMAGETGREVLKHYTVALAERFAEVSVTGALVFYSLFVMSERPELVVTIPLVLFGLFRYWFIVESLQGGESPADSLLADRLLSLTIVAWVVLTIWVYWPGTV